MTPFTQGLVSLFAAEQYDFHTLRAKGCDTSQVSQAQIVGTYNLPLSMLKS